ncbi:MAG: hypothetical protein E7589_01430 [Ruminococcaceae bacterium]|nr:hypothetical protein [Oscillospiraceae bacterium]
MNSNVDNAYVIAAIALLSTIIGPILTATITAIHESMMYKKRFHIEHKFEAIERYLHAAGRYAFCLDYDDLKDWGDAVSEIFMYTPPEFWEDIQNLNTLINAKSNATTYASKEEYTPQIREAYLDLCERLADLNRSGQKHNKRKCQKPNKRVDNNNAE